LYESLLAQKAVMGAREKEVHFFDLMYYRGPGWYRSHFPASAAVWSRSAMSGSPVAVGEASPYYLFHPDVPRRVATSLPRARFVVLLRNPVERAYSHYCHERVLGHEWLSFQEALEAEEERLAGEELRLMRDEDYSSFAHRHYSYFARGCYAAQLRRWLDVFPREQFLVLPSEQLFSDPAATIRRVLGFLGAADSNLRPPRRRPGATHPLLPSDMRAVLARRYAEPNADLAQLVDGFAPDLAWVSSRGAS
jgi:hypothetical protein